MKRLHAIIICGLLLAAFCFTTDISAFTLGVDYNETIQDNGLGAVGFDYVSTVNFRDNHGFIPLLHTESWAHSLSTDYMPVPDAFKVTNARLDIFGYQYLGTGLDMVSFGGTCEWTQSSGWHWVSGTHSAFDLSDIDDSFWNSNPFVVSMTPVFDLGVRVTRSVLSLDYAQSDDNGQYAAVPEPTSILLLGLGLVGAAGYRLRRRSA